MRSDHREHLGRRERLGRKVRWGQLAHLHRELADLGYWGHMTVVGMGRLVRHRILERYLGQEGDRH